MCAHNNRDDMDAMMHRMEWTTLLFFAAMFVTMECLERLGLISWIGEQTKKIILSIENEDARLAVAIIIILWVCVLFVCLHKMQNVYTEYSMIAFTIGYIMHILHVYMRSILICFCFVRGNGYVLTFHFK